MASAGLSHLPIEYISLDTTIPLAFLILGLVQVFLYMILDWDNSIYSFFLESKSSSAFQFDAKNNSKVVKDEKNSKDSGLIAINQQQLRNGEISISSEEVEVVFKSLRLFSNPESANLRERYDCNDLCDLFEKMEASEEQVKAVFDVFDENKDGFIDAKELQRVLSALGFREGSELEKCRKMIRMFDDNGDGRIDFAEFVKVMESSFC